MFMDERFGVQRGRAQVEGHRVSMMVMGMVMVMAVVVGNKSSMCTQTLRLSPPPPEGRVIHPGNPLW